MICMVLRGWLFWRPSQKLKKSWVFILRRGRAHIRGIYYKFVSDGSEIFVLKGNVDPFDGEPVEQMFSGYPVLLYVGMTLRSEEIKSLLSAGFDLLRHELFD